MNASATAASTAASPAASTPTALPRIAFIGGGNMASAVIGGLLGQGMAPARIHVVEPFAAARERLQGLGVNAAEAADAALRDCPIVVWAVKPQTFREAAAAAAPFTAAALHLSVAAGIRTASMGRWLGTERIVRAMPNTPALVGQGMTGLFAAPAVSAADRADADAVLASTGHRLWVEKEEQLDAVTALSGSGPAYVFYFLEAMCEAGTQMGLTAAQARQLAVATFSGASALAAASDDALEEMRQRVTSKGGTTYAAITSMQQAGVHAAFVAAMQAARRRAAELGDEFGK